MSNTPSQHTYRNDDYYLLGGDLHFLVGKREFFRVHRYFFDRESEYFRNFFQKRPTGGVDDSSAIVLDDLEPKEFEMFLWVFYNPTYCFYDAGIDEWAIILGLAQQWGFAIVKQLAVMQLAKINMNLVDRIELYQRWDVDQDVLLPYYVQLCEREQNPTFPEMIRLGQRTAYIIYSARERLRAASVDEYGSSPVVEGRDVRATIEGLLKDVPQTQVDLMKESGRLARLRRHLAPGRGSARTSLQTGTKALSSIPTLASTEEVATNLRNTSTVLHRPKIRWTITPPSSEEEWMAEGAKGEGVNGDDVQGQNHVQVPSRTSSLRKRISLAWKESKIRRRSTQSSFRMRIKPLSEPDSEV